MTMTKTTTLDLRQQIGQLLIFGFDGPAMDSKLLTTLTSLRPGGIILFARNIESPQQTWKLLRARIIKHTSGPLNAKGTDVAMEELVLAYERLEME